MDISATTEIAGLPVVMRHDPQRHLEPLIKMSVDWVLGQIPDGNGKRIMDLGGSYGYAASLFREAGWFVDNIDKYPPKEYIGEAPWQLDWDYMSETLRQEYSLVFFNHGIEHALSAYRVMEQISKVTKPGGYLFLGCPHGMFPWAYELEKSTTHFTLVTPEFLRVMVPRYGYEEIATELRCSRKDYVEILSLWRKKNGNEG